MRLSLSREDFGADDSIENRFLNSILIRYRLILQPPRIPDLPFPPLSGVGHSTFQCDSCNSTIGHFPSQGLLEAGQNEVQIILRSGDRWRLGMASGPSEWWDSDVTMRMREKKAPLGGSSIL